MGNFEHEVEAIKLQYDMIYALFFTLFSHQLILNMIMTFHGFPPFFSSAGHGAKIDTLGSKASRKKSNYSRIKSLTRVQLSLYCR